MINIKFLLRKNGELLAVKKQIFDTVISCGNRVVVFRNTLHVGKTHAGFLNTSSKCTTPSPGKIQASLFDCSVYLYIRF